jgi:hypothetical protein
MFKDYMEMKHSNVQNLAPLAGLPQAAIIFASKNVRQLILADVRCVKHQR